MRRVAGIVLAAGEASRLGRAKQLLPLAGKPVIAYVIDAARQTHLSPLVVVLGAYASEIETHVPDLPAEAMVVRNGRYQEGQSTSLQAGIRVLPDDVEGALILLADQPEIEAPVIDAV
ncbi:MAG TPA: nucleotidyltransferase family protein, partial [Thermomicrobiaceae bacterium]|nr:nucleotidyltransferase family protein [Thermomicrobiaceae bacterium]